MLLAIITGILFGITPTPIIAIQDNPKYFPNEPQTNLPYMFSFFFGAFLQSSIIFILYSLYK